MNGNINVELIAAKSLISPLKPIELPRLELQDAVLLAQFVERIRPIIPCHINSVDLWTDATIVSNWLPSHPSRWSAFVVYRVSLIQKLTRDAPWLKIDSKLKPADIVRVA